MTLQIIFAYVHYLTFALLAACLLIEFLLLAQSMPAATVRRIRRVDTIYAISAVVMLASGVGRVFTEKGLDYYLANHVFGLKMILFAAIGLLSIYPTIRFVRWVPDGERWSVEPSEYGWIRRLLHVQLALLLLLPLCAVLMARGIGGP